MKPGNGEGTANDRLENVLEVAAGQLILVTALKNAWAGDDFDDETPPKQGFGRSFCQVIQSLNNV
jgi:hypothetical protein